MAAEADTCMCLVCVCAVVAKVAYTPGPQHRKKVTITIDTTKKGTLVCRMFAFTITT